MNSDRIAGAATDLAGRAEGVAGNLTGDAKLQAEGTIDQLKGTAQNLAGQAKDTIQNVAGQAGDYAQDAYERGRAAYSRGRDAIPDSAVNAYRDGSRVVSAQVQDSPLAALLIAGAVGYALGWLIHGRS